MNKVTVTKVIDGDTFKDSQGKYYRLAEVDTPEKGSSKYGKAKEILQRKIEQEQVYVKILGKSYGRAVVEARVKGEKGTVNDALKRAGFGV